MITPQWTKTIGGPSAHVNNLSTELRKLGQQVWILSPDMGDGAICIGSNIFIQILSIFRWLIKIKPEVIHIHGRIKFIPPALMYKILSMGSCRVLFNFHTQPYFKSYLPISAGGTPDYSVMGRIVAKWFLHKCDEIISCSHSLICNLNKYYQLDINKYTVLYTGAEIPAIDSKNLVALKTDFELGASYPILTSIGVFSWDWKVAGHQICIEAMPRLIDKFPNIKLLIVGRGAHEEFLIDVVRKNKIEKNVIFLGYTEYLREVLDLTDIYIHMALNEAMGLSLVEAMHAGKPIIVANRGGLPELIEHNISGLVIEPTSSELAQSIDYLLRNENIRFKISKNSLEYAQNFLGLKYFAQCTLDIYGKPSCVSSGK